MPRNLFLCLSALVVLALVGWASAPRQAAADDATPSPTPSMTITVTPSNDAAIAQMMTAQAPLEVVYEGVYSVALEFRAPLRAALEHDRALLLEASYTVSAFRDTLGWAKITLVPTRFVDAGWSDAEQINPVEVILRQAQTGPWSGFLVGSAAFAAILNDVPLEFVDYRSPLPPVEAEYKFPWQSGEEWWAIQGWHDGSALDFQPGLTARFAVLAAQSGRLREVCSDGTQSLLQIQHADGRSTYYLHLTLGLAVRRTLLDHNVRQGQYLGELFRQHPFVTPCGQGYSRHLHFAVSDRSLRIEGYALEGIATTASCCTHPPTYRSSNLRVDDSTG